MIGPGPAPASARDLLARSGDALDQLFAASPPGTMPEGECVGTAIVRPGSLLARPVAWLVRCLLWQGKVFDARGGFLVNRLGFPGFRGIRARVGPGASWLDGRPCIVLDYSKTSLVARAIRDEIREVAPGLHLGQVFWGRKRILRFAVSQRFEPPRHTVRRLASLLLLALLVAGIFLGRRLTSDRPVVHSDSVEHFKYGSLGGERGSGIPKSLWTLMPELFPEHLPGPGLASLGFIYEPGHELPIGVSEREVQGLPRVFLNCAACHVGTVRMTREAPRQVVVGMPANGLDLQAFEHFLFACVADEKFTGDRVALELEARGSEDWLNRQLLRLLGVGLMRERLLMINDRFAFLDREPEGGPGRVDTFNAPKVLLGFDMEKLPREEWIGQCDFPSIWNQKQREGLWLHWDGNNDSVSERNRSAAFGTGATPTTLDRDAMQRVEDWLRSDGNRPPAYPGPIDLARAERGRALYGQYCADCHGRSGTDFRGVRVGQVTPIAEIGTDRHRLDSYSADLCANQNLLYAAYPDERFRHFRKTYGYANQPLDGLWLRAPYLHNGSVPTLRELLDPADRRRVKFFRGCDLYDQQRVGFVADVPEEAGRRYFEFDTTREGNRNIGHEGPEYGTDLPAPDKDAIVEYLKTF